MEKYLSPEEVCELVPGVTPQSLAQMRFRGDGPKFIKPSPRRVVYDRTDIETWLSSRKHVSTREPVA